MSNKRCAYYSINTNQKVFKFMDVVHHIAENIVGIKLFLNVPKQHFNK